MPPLIQALLEPRRYPHPVQAVELVETHISWVLLAGDFAYKIKKPLKLPFLDFSTLAQRKTSCDEELRLNRRFAPDLYLDVVGIFNTPLAPRFDGPGTPIEYAVKMRRFDEAGRLDRVCARGALVPRHLSDLADALVAFHEAAAVAPVASRFGCAAATLKPALENFRELLQASSPPELLARLKVLKLWTESQHRQLAPLMEARKIAGRVRECHGDLHLANLVLIGERVRMFDCIEFNEDLRWIDVASDIAFTYVDLLAHHQAGLADWFVDEVLSRSGDYEAVQVLRFYAVYRALVRAKVAAIRMRQAREGESELLAYVALAERLCAPARQRLVITHGLSGCGKTVASSALLQGDPKASTLRLRSDVERKRLFGLPSTARSDSSLDAGIYAANAHALTYARLRDLAERVLRAGWSVIVDATFLKRSDRDAFCALAKEAGVAFSILAPQATPEQLRERIKLRNALGREASEATLEVLAQQMRALEALQSDESELSPDDVPHMESHMNENDLIYSFAKKHVIQASGLVALLMPQTFDVAMGVKSLDGRYQLANKAMQALFNKSAEQLMNITDRDLFPVQVVAQLQDSDQRIAAGAATSTDTLDFSVNDKAVQCLCLKFPIHGPDDQILFIGSAMLDTAGYQNMSKMRESLERLQRTNQDLQKTLVELDRLASTDKLTGAWNRRRLEETLRNEMDRLKRYEHPLSMMIIDIDFFKKVNDVHGHNVGDQVLVKLATVLQSTLRTTDSLTRWGGEEFVVLCPNTTLSTASMLAERLRETVSRSPFPEVKNVTVSIGVAECMVGEAWEAWFKRADAALYRAKACGRNQVQIAPETPQRLGVGENVAANFVNLSWHGAYECGNALIDEQHRGLFNDANNLLGAILSGRPKDEVAALIDRLISDVVKHFKDEEAIFTAAGYPGAKEHAAIHRRLVDDATNLVNRFQAGTLAIGELFQFLAHDVVARHMLGADREFFPYLTSQGV